MSENKDFDKLIEELSKLEKQSEVLKERANNKNISIEEASKLETDLENILIKMLGILQENKNILEDPEIKEY